MIEINEASFRLIIRLWWVSLLALIFTAMLLENQSLESAAEALVEGSDLVAENVRGPIALIYLTSLIVSGIMLHRFKPIGRSSFLVLQILGIVYTGLSGYQVLSAYMYAVDSLNMMLSGAILVLAYTPQGSELFVKHANGG